MISELASRLDEQYPGWAARIDLATLNMNDSKCCVIGQGVTNGERMDYGKALTTLVRAGDPPIGGFFVGRWASEWQTEIKTRRN